MPHVQAQLCQRIRLEAALQAEAVLRALPLPGRDVGTAGTWVFTE
jgi:hypothetical protein